MEERVPEDHRHPRVGHRVREVAASLVVPRREVEVADVRSLEAVEREEPPRRVSPPDPRHGDPRVRREVPPERLGVPCLLLVVELEPDRAAELLDELAGVDEVELADALARDPGG